MKTLDVLTAVTEPPLMIRPEDKCDPESLLENHEPCLMRVALALKNYSRIFGDAGLFKEGCTKCSKWKSNAVTVVEVTRKLLDELKQKHEAPEPLNPADWMIEGLLRDSVDRLYSFSIITARIFSFLSHQHQQTGNSVNDNLL
uniref:Uncharacterized protein n=1 Tax=Astyanax mexicanus TaxID=7994 RepID=A0A8B9HNN8_ASTMX